MSNDVSMFGKLVLVLVRRFANGLAWAIGFVHVNQIHPDAANPDMMVKTRSVWNWLPVLIGNWVFRFRTPALCVQRTGEWIDWELAMAREMGQFTQPLKSGLCVNRLSGQSLAFLLKQPGHSERRKRQWVELAARALAELHRIQVDWAGQGQIAVSHADASVSNVMIDADHHEGTETNVDSDRARATWFDFDLRHDLRVAALERHADDLRALLFTAVVCCHWDDLAGLITGLKQSYPHPETWSVLTQIVWSGKIDYDVFHLAQLRRANPRTTFWSQASRVKELL